MHHELTHRPTVWDSAPISVRLMCLIYQRESSVVSAAAEDKTSPPPEIILLSFPVSFFTMAASMRQVSILAFVEGEKKKIRNTGGRAGIMYERSPSGRQGALTLRCGSLDRDQCTQPQFTNTFFNGSPRELHRASSLLLVYLFILILFSPHPSFSTATQTF